MIVQFRPGGFFVGLSTIMSNTNFTPSKEIARSSENKTDEDGPKSNCSTNEDTCDLVLKATESSEWFYTAIQQLVGE